jgi:cell division protease FtsH
MIRRFFCYLFLLSTLYVDNNYSFFERENLYFLRDDTIIATGLKLGFGGFFAYEMFMLMTNATQKMTNTVKNIFTYNQTKKLLMKIKRDKKNEILKEEKKSEQEEQQERSLKKEDDFDHDDYNNDIEDNQDTFRYLAYDKTDTVFWEDIIVEKQLKDDLLNHVSCVLNHNQDQSMIEIPNILCLYGLPGMNKTDLIKGIANKLNIPIFIFDPILLDSNFYQNVTIEALISYAEGKNFAKGTPCIIHIKNVEKMHKNFILGSFMKMLQYGFNSQQNILFSFSCNNDYFIKDLWIHKNKLVKFVVLHRPNYQSRKDILSLLLDQYGSKINTSLVDRECLARFFDKMTIEDIRVVVEKAIEKKIINKFAFQGEGNSEYPCLLANQDFIDEYSIFIKNNSLVSSKENELNNGLLRVDQFIVEKPKVGFKDVIGLEHIKDKLKFLVSYLQSPEKYRNLGIRVPKGVLFKGEPGCGKTLMAKALAGESDISIIVVNGSDFIEKYVGEGARRVREVFDMAKIWSPTIIFIDEIDAIAIKRGSLGDAADREYSQTLNELLVQMDGFSEENKNVIVIGSTNRDLSALDDALLRRFEEKFNFRLPIYTERLEMLKLYIKDMEVNQNISFENIAALINGFSGADIEYLVNEAKLVAMEREKRQLRGNFFNFVLSEEDIVEAYNNFCLGYKIKNHVALDNQVWKTAIHEIGHTLCMLYKQGYFVSKNNNEFEINEELIRNALRYDMKSEVSSDDFLQVTVVPRDVGNGTILGMASSIPLYDFYCHSSEELKKQIIVCLGGLAAEKIIFKDSFDGVSSDLEQASHLAKSMITRFGMTDLMYSSNWSEKLTEKQIEKAEIILKDSKDKCEQFLSHYKLLLIFLAKKLKEQKTLTKRVILKEISKFYGILQGDDLLLE